MNLQHQYWNGRYSDEGAIWGNDPCLAAKKAEQEFRVFSHGKILVPGCGYGRNSGYLADCGFSVIGFDISDVAIQLAKKRENSGVAAEYSQDDVLDKDFDEEFDGILSINMLHLFDSQKQDLILEKYAKFLKPGGKLILTSMSVNDADFGKGTKLDDFTYESKQGRPVHYFNVETMRKLIERFFEATDVEEIKEFENHGGKEHYHHMIFVAARKR